MCKKKHRAASLGDRGALCLGDRSPPKRRAEPSGRDQDWLSEPLTNATSEDESPLALQNYPDPPTATMPVEPKVYRGTSAALLDNRENPRSGSRSGGRAAVRASPPKPRFIEEQEHVAAEAILRRAFAEETDPSRLVPSCEKAWQQRANELAKADTNPLRSQRPFVTSPVPSAGAALKSTSSLESDSRMLFAGYQESADDAAHLMLDGGGMVLSVMSSKQTQKMAVYLITKAVKNIIMTVYTYDLLVIGDALKSAAGRGVKVEVIADYGHTLTGTTVAMVERMKGLLESGVHVVLTKGASGNSGIQHSKTLLSDEHVIVGSCNWTTSSRSNQEMSILVALNDAGMSSWQERLSYLKRHGRPMTEEDVVKGQATRDQRKASHSVPPADRYGNARRFSIHARRASARSASRDPTSSA